MSAVMDWRTTEQDERNAWHYFAKGRGVRHFLAFPLMCLIVVAGFSTGVCTGVWKIRNRLAGRAIIGAAVAVVVAIAWRYGR